MRKNSITCSVIITVLFLVILFDVSLHISNTVITKESLVITFIGGLSTFVVISNYAQASQIKSEMDEKFDNLNSQITKIQEISELSSKNLITSKDLFYSYLSKAADDFKNLSTSEREKCINDINMYLDTDDDEIRVKIIYITDIITRQFSIEQCNSDIYSKIRYDLIILVQNTVDLDLFTHNCIKSFKISITLADLSIGQKKLDSLQHSLLIINSLNRIIFQKKQFNILGLSTDTYQEIEKILESTKKDKFYEFALLMINTFRDDLSNFSNAFPPYPEDLYAELKKTS